jgi:hypothetical protein
MIRYSSYGSTNNRAPSERTYHLETLAAEYRELQELRERVKKAEAAAAQRLKSRGEGKSSSASNGGVHHHGTKTRRSSGMQTASAKPYL